MKDNLIAYRATAAISIVGNEIAAKKLIEEMLGGKEDAIGRPLWSWSPCLLEIMGQGYYPAMYQDWLALANIAGGLKNRQYGAQLMLIAAVALKRRASLDLSWLIWGCSADKIAAANVASNAIAQVVKAALAMLKETDGIQNANCMIAALEEMQKNFSWKVKAANALEPKFKFLSAVRKSIRIREKPIEEILQDKSEAKAKMHEVEDFIHEALGEGIDPDSGEFKEKLGKLRNEIKDICSRNAIIIPPEWKATTAA